MILYVIRHGQPIYGPDTLTELGKKQAKALAERFKVHGLDRIFASSHGRAQETAAPTAEALGLPIEIEDWTSEKYAAKYFFCENDGKRDWIFRSRVERLADPRLRALGDAWQSGEVFADTGAVEGFEFIAEHSDEFIARLGYVKEGTLYRALRPNDDKIAVFCHQGFGMSWMSYLLGIPPQYFYPAFNITHSGVIVIHFANTESGLTSPRCLGFSDMSHIFADPELEMKFENKFDI